MRRVLLTAAAVAAAAFVLATCRNPILPPGALTVVGATRTPLDAAGGFIASVDCSPALSAQAGLHGTEVGTTSYCTATLQNSGSSDVTIEGAELLLLNTSTTPVGLNRNQSVFTWAHNPPDLPITLAPSQSVPMSIAFNPTTAGVQTASLNLHTTAGDQQVRITGEGGWIVTLVASGAYGSIVQPIAVAAGSQATYVAVDPDLTLQAQGDSAHFYELQNWSASPAANATIASTTATSTTATVTGSVTITATFYSPYVFVQAGAGGSGTQGAPIGTLEGAVAAYNGTSICNPCRAIVMTTGTYTLGASVDLPAGAVYGGYAVGTNFSSRINYQDPTTRAGGTVINTNGYDLVYDGNVTSGISASTLLEGVAITAGNPASGAGARSDNMYAALGVENGASPTLQYDTFTGGGGSSPNSIGVYVYDSSPTIDSSVLVGGTTSGAAAKSIGLWTNFQSAPTVTNDTISGGTASDSKGVSYGIFNENYAGSPNVQNCTIDGGSGSSIAAGVWTGYGGQPQFQNNTIYTEKAAATNYGIYIGPNGRIYVLTGNNIYNAPDALVYDASATGSETAYTSIDDVNTAFVPTGDTPNTSTAP